MNCVDIVMTCIGLSFSFVMVSFGIMVLLEAIKDWRKK